MARIHKTQKYFLPYESLGMCELLSLVAKLHVHPSLLLCDSVAGSFLLDRPADVKLCQ